MATTTAPGATAWTIADLYRRFGPIPFDRIRHDPAPGTATEADVLAIHDHEDLLYELVDGILVRKTMGSNESYLAVVLASFLSQFVRPRKLGIVLGADGMLRLNRGLVRIPDVSFIAAERFPNRRRPEARIWPLVPDLTVEVLSEGNTRKEMAEKLAEYFAAGVRLVWYVDPEKRTVRAFTAPDSSRLLRENQTGISQMSVDLAVHGLVRLS